jgi:hypothetical protein
MGCALLVITQKVTCVYQGQMQKLRSQKTECVLLDIMARATIALQTPVTQKLFFQRMECVLLDTMAKVTTAWKMADAFSSALSFCQPKGLSGLIGLEVSDEIRIRYASWLAEETI